MSSTTKNRQVRLPVTCRGCGARFEGRTVAPVGLIDINLPCPTCKTTITFNVMVTERGNNEVVTRRGTGLWR